jgi:hypothetical protein
MKEEMTHTDKMRAATQILAEMEAETEKSVLDAPSIKSVIVLVVMLYIGVNLFFRVVLPFLFSLLQS